MVSSTIIPDTAAVLEPRAHSRRRPGEGLKNPRIAIVIFSSLVLGLLLLASLASSAFGLPADSLIYPMSVVLTILFAAEIWSWYRISHSLFDPYVIFLIAAMLFNGSAAVLETFGLAPPDPLGTQFSAQTTLTTFYLVALGLWSYHLGGMLGASRSRTIDATPAKDSAASRRRLRALGWLLIGIAIVPTFLHLRHAAIVVMSSGYFGMFQLHPPTSFNALPLLLAQFLIPGVLMVAVAGKGKRLQLGMSAALISMFALTELFIGSRGMATSSVAAYAWVWHRCVKPISKVPIIIGLILGVTILPLVAVSRSFVGGDRLSPDKMLHAFSSIDNPLVSIMSEMGGTATTIAYTVDLVPNHRPYAYGSSYGFGFLALMPNLFWDIHPSAAHASPADWLIRTVDPDMAALGGGLGYSFVAEGYLNWGWAGVILVSGILGFWFSRLTSRFSKTGDLAKIACAATILAFTLQYARGDCTVFIRGVFWYALGTYALAQAMRLKPKKSYEAPRWAEIDSVQY